MCLQCKNKEKISKTLKARTGLQDLGVDGKIIFNYTLQNYNVTLGLDTTSSGQSEMVC
jgi:hypothetical protein